MELTWDDIIIDLTEIDLEKIISTWKWLIGDNKQPILISSIGDLYLKDENENCFWLNVGEGILEKIADSVAEFEEKINDYEIASEWFLIELVKSIKESGLNLTENMLYGYKVLPILGGDFIPENFELIKVETHFELNGLIHKQIKDLPDGSEINIEVK
jgi:hypothetical protein